MITSSNPLVSTRKSFRGFNKTSPNGANKVPIANNTVWVERLTLSGDGNTGNIKLYTAGANSRYDLMGTIKPDEVWECPIASGSRIDLSTIYYSCPRGNRLRAAYTAAAVNPAVKPIGEGDTIVLANGTTTAVADGTTGNVSVPTNGFLQTCNKGHLSRIRQCGSIQRVEFYVALVAGLHSIKVQVWRRNNRSISLAGMYTKVGESENLLSKVQPGVKSTIDLEKPIKNVQDGDFVGFLIENTTSSAVSNVLKTETPANWTITNWSGAGYPSAPQDPIALWEATSTGYASASVAYVIGVYMASPVFAAIGDSLTAGSNTETNFPPYFRDETELWVPDNSIIYNLASRYLVNYQNQGIGGQTSTQVAARISTDTVASGCKIAVVQCGVNDLVAIGGAATVGAYAAGQATFIANYTTILDALVGAGIIPVVLPIFPWTGDTTTYGTNAQMTARDLWNAALQANVAEYPTALFVPMDATLGQNRVGGASGNLWNIKTAYRDGGATQVHLNDVGYIAASVPIKTAIDAYCVTNGYFI